MTFAVAGLLAVGCNDLDTEPLGSTVTSKQKEEVLEIDPSKAEAAVFALQYNTHIAGQFYSTQHRSYGFASMFLGLDSRGTDLVANDDGYNWYSADASWADWAGNYYANLIYWQVCYTQIQTCNTIAATISMDTEDPSLKYYLGQALIFRSYCYYMLVNMYQLTWANNPDAPCVPIITEENMVEAGINGNARATVQQVWDRVITDATNAINLLTEAADAGITRPDRRFADVAVAYGMRARANLFIHEWASAAADAQKAIDLSDARPYSITEASVPGFYKLTNPNYMWGIENPSSMGYTQGVVNFASMMGSWMPNGYNTVGCARRISKKLYAEIPATDCRRNWWIDANGTVPAALPQAYKSWLAADPDNYPAYTQCKFAAADNNPGQPSGATDVPMMRIEEMYLILAEAQGMTSPSTGAATLQSFVRAYRDGSYSCTAASKEDLRMAVWTQRRIELWGEGFAYFDRLRYMTGIDRRGHGFPSAWVFVVSPTVPVNRYQIIQSEVQANPLISEDDANELETWTTPSPVDDDGVGSADTFDPKTF